MGVAALAGLILAWWGIALGFRMPQDAPVEAVAVSENGHDLYVRHTGGEPGCGGAPYRVDVEVSESRVTLRARLLRPIATSCSDVGAPFVSTVRLGEPVGDRQIVDGSTHVWVEVPIVPVSELLH